MKKTKTKGTKSSKGKGFVAAQSKGAYGGGKGKGK